MNEYKLFEYYVLIELAYEKIFKDVEEKYPLDWYNIKDRKEKINILVEALNKNILIKDTESYRKTKSSIKRLL